MQLAGLQLGGYHILQQIGSGGMGEVYLAEDPRINRNVALKVIRIEKLLSPDPAVAQEAIRLFRREAKAVAKLDHPHILTLYHYDEDVIQGTRLLYIVMPLCVEGSLVTWLRKRTTNPLLSPEEAAPLLLQVADALQHAHDKQVIHLDVKPANLLLRSQSNSAVPDLLLADFGIAAILNATTSEGFRGRGTPAYMAPEQWEGHPAPATDQYALAVMAYYLLTGRTPFQGNLYQLEHQHRNTPPQPPSTLNPRISQDIDEVILKALQKKPEDRYSSVLHFAQAFEDAVQSTEASPTKNMFSRIRRIRLKNPLKLSIFAAATLGLTFYLISPAIASPVVPIMGLAFIIISWLLGLAQSGWLEQWNWFVGILLASPIAGIIYGLVGPTTKPRGAQISPLVRIYRDKTNKARQYVLSAIGLVLLADVIGIGYYTNYTVNNAIYNATAPRMENTFAMLTHGNPTQYYSLVNNMGDNKWEERADCTFTAGAYQVSNDSQEDFNPCFLQNATFKDFVFQVQMKLLAGNAGGILFRDSGGNGRALFYYLSISQLGDYDLSLYVDRQGSNNYSVMSGTAQPFRTGLGQINTIAILVKGSILDLFINGYFVDSSNDSGSEQGTIALVAKSSAVVVYSDAEVWML